MVLKSASIALVDLRQFGGELLNHKEGLLPQAGGINTSSPRTARLSMRLHQFTDEAPTSPAPEDGDEIDAMGAELVRTLHSIAGRLQQFITLLDEDERSRQPAAPLSC